MLFSLWAQEINSPPHPREGLGGGAAHWPTGPLGGGGVGVQADLQRQQQLDSIGERRGSRQAQQAEGSEEQEVGEGPGEGQGVAGAAFLKRKLMGMARRITMR